MEFRRITLEDIERVRPFVVEGMRTHLYPLHLEDAKIDATIQALVDDQRGHWQLAAFENNGRMCGGLGALVCEMPWFERYEAHIIMFRATRPGVGDTLMQRFMQWVRENISVRRVFWPMEFDAPLGMLRLARGYGFNSSHAVASYYKG
jgi:hypothetical protein